MNGLWRRRWLYPAIKEEDDDLNNETADGDIFKCFDFFFVQNLDTTPSLLILNDLRSGPNFYERIGDRVNWVFMTVKYNLGPQAITFNESIGLSYRVAIVYDDQPNGKYPAYSDIFQDVGLTGITNSDVRSSINWANRDRFVILFDNYQPVQNCIELPDGSSALWPSLSGSDCNVNGICSLDGLQSVYINNLGGVLDFNVLTGAIYLVVFSDQSYANLIQAISVHIRFYFTDK